MKNLKFLIPTAVLLALLVVSWPGTPALANPFYVGTKAKSAVATSTLAYMTPGAATSTTVYDSYEVNGTNQTNGGQTTLPETVAFLLQGNASSTATIVNVACEFGDDETNAAGITSIDWYQNDVTIGTTTLPGGQNISMVNTFTFTYASSTVGGTQGLASTSRFAKIVTCPVPTRYVRAVASVTGANAGIWVGIVPKKQRN